MSPVSDVIIIVGNYSHDVATALLASSAVVMWILSKKYPAPDNPGVEICFVRIYKSITRIARDSLYWILIAGVPRIIFYKQYEWSDRAGNLQVAAIVIKHIVMFSLVGAGLFYWARLAGRVSCLKLKHNLN